MSKMRTRRQKAIIRRRIFLSCCALLLVSVIALISFIVHSIISPDEKADKNGPTKTESQILEESVPEIKETFANPPTLNTQRLDLVKISPEHAEDMYEYSRDPDVTKYLTWSCHSSVKETERYIKLLQKKMK